MSEKDLIQKLEEACFNNAYRQDYGSWESCVESTLTGLNEMATEESNSEAIRAIEWMGIGTVTMLSIMSTVQAYRGRRGIWRQLTNGIDLVIRGVQYLTNFVRGNQAENDVEIQSRRSESSIELNVTPIPPRIVHYPPATANQTTTQPPLHPPPQSPPIQSRPIQPPPIEPPPIEPPPIEPPPAQFDNNGHEQDNAPLTMPNTPSPTLSRSTIKPDAEITETTETTNEEAQDITIVPIQSKISLKNQYLLNI